MTKQIFRALVVDDDGIARSVVMHALTEEGFRCDPALDGVEALNRCRETEYDLVVTDLRMPNKHGHSLAVDILSNMSSHQPLIVVHTSLDDARLTKDLILRGVSDVVYKPTNYSAFAAKMRALVIRHRQGSRPSQNAATSANTSSLPPRIPIDEFDSRLLQISHILPISDVSISVMEKIQSEEYDNKLLASLLERDAVLAAELLRIANSSLYNRRGGRVINLQEAVSRIGAARVGEISLVVSALGAMTGTVLPWFDRDLAWQRSIAAAMAANRVAELMGTNTRNHGVVFSALMYPLSRVILGTAYPEIYQSLLKLSQHSGDALLSLEARVFPRTPAAAAAQILSRWDLPVEVCLPLIHADTPLACLQQLPGPIRHSVTTLKLSILLGEFAVGRWMPWDNIELADETILAQHGVDDPASVIEDIRRDLTAHGSFDPVLRRAFNSKRSSESSEAIPLPYLGVAEGTFDFVHPLLQSMGFKLMSSTPDRSESPTALVVNCRGCDYSATASTLEQHPADHYLLIGDHLTCDSVTEFGNSAFLPASYSALQALCRGSTSAQPSPHRLDSVVGDGSRGIAPAHELRSAHRQTSVEVG